MIILSLDSISAAHFNRSRNRDIRTRNSFFAYLLKRKSKLSLFKDPKIKKSRKKSPKKTTGDTIVG